MVVSILPKSLRRLLLSVFVVAFAGVAQASSVGYVDIQVAINASNAVKVFKEQLAKDLKSAQSQLAALEKAAKEKQDELKQNEGLVSREQLVALDQDFKRALQAFQQQRQKLAQQKAQREQAFLRQIDPTLQAGVAKIAEAKKLDIVVRKEAVAYAATSLDITAELIEYLNANN